MISIFIIIFVVVFFATLKPKFGNCISNFIWEIVWYIDLKNVTAGKHRVVTSVNLQFFYYFKQTRITTHQITEVHDIRIAHMSSCVVGS